MNPRIPRLAALLPLVVGCTGPASTAPAEPAPWAGACVLAPAAGASGASDNVPSAEPLRVSIPRSVAPGAGPATARADARVVLRQLYETLVEVDCEGRLRPGLAASWSSGDEGRRWRFTLEPGARFWDGTPVTAEAVARSWLARGSAARPPAGMPRIVSASVEAPLELSVVLRDPTQTPESFARPATAVTGEGSLGGWPMGSGVYRPVAATARGGRMDLMAGADGAERGLSFVPAPGRDGRAALDAGADVMVSADPAVIAYARALPDVAVTPLPWSRTYVLVATEGGAWGAEAAPTAPVEALEELARDAVRAEARPAQSPFWWRGAACGREPIFPVTVASPPGHAAEDPGPDAPVRIAYPLGDGVARGIAERLVALTGRGSAVPAWLVTAIEALGSTTGPVVAVGLDSSALAGALARRDALAFVVPVPRAPGGACTSALLAAEDEVGRAVYAEGARLRITPLVDVRSSLLLRRGATGIALDGDGTLRFLPGSRTPSASRRP